MSNIKERIQTETIAARKARDTDKLEALQAVKAMVELISKAPTEADYITALNRVIKQYHEMGSYAVAATRDESFQKAFDAYSMLEDFLPKALDTVQVTELVKQIAAENNLIFEKKNMGNIVKLTVLASAGATDGKTVSTIVNLLIEAAKSD